MTSNDFIEQYSTYEEALEAAKNDEEHGKEMRWYFDYAIYEEVETKNNRS